MSQLGSDSPSPMSSDFDTSGEPPVWPKVIGIISIVWGSLAVVCNVCGLVGPAIQGAFVNMMPPEQQAQMKAQMAAGHTPLAMASAALSMLGGVLLVVAGIQTVRRRAVGRPLHLAWAVAGLLLAALGGVVGWQNMQQQFQSMQNDPNAKQAMAAAQGVGTAVFGCMMLLAVLYPIFCLVWFGMLGKRPEVGVGSEEPIV